MDIWDTLEFDEQVKILRRAGYLQPRDGAPLFTYWKYLSPRKKINLWNPMQEYINERKKRLQQSRQGL